MLSFSLPCLICPIKYSPACCPASPAQSNTLLLAVLPHLLNQILSCTLSCPACPIKYSPARCPALPAQSNILLLAVQPLLLIIQPLVLDALPHLLTAHSAAQPLLLLPDLPLLYTVLPLFFTSFPASLTHDPDPPADLLLIVVCTLYMYRISCRGPGSRFQAANFSQSLLFLQKKIVEHDI
jgi:hypothetical protein